MSENYADIANNAADHMERVGSRAGTIWTRACDGYPYDGGTVCMLGALAVAQGQTDIRYETDFDGSLETMQYLTPIGASLAKFIKPDSDLEGSWPVASYNDKTSHEQRVQMLRDFATKHESDEFRSTGDTV